MGKGGIVADDQKIKKPREKICAYCKSFTFRARKQRGQAYCLKKGKWFPNQTTRDVPTELMSSWTPVGLRTCKDWS